MNCKHEYERGLRSQLLYICTRTQLTSPHRMIERKLSNKNSYQVKKPAGIWAQQYPLTRLLRMFGRRAEKMPNLSMIRCKIKMPWLALYMSHLYTTKANIRKPSEAAGYQRLID